MTKTERVVGGLEIAGPVRNLGSDSAVHFQPVSIGDSNCPKCGGVGSFAGTAKPVTDKLNRNEQLFGGLDCRVQCPCVKIAEFKRFVGADWLVKANRLTRTPYSAWANENLYLTATTQALAPHLATILWERWEKSKREQLPFKWKCITDADVINLALGKLKNENGEVATFYDLDDIPFLVVLTGRVMRNRYAPDAFLEFVSHRFAEEKRLWIVDEPEHRIRKEEIAVWSEKLETVLQDPNYFARHWESEGAQDDEPLSFEERAENRRKRDRTTNYSRQ